MRTLLIFTLFIFGLSLGCATPKNAAQAPDTSPDDLITELHFGSTLRLTPLSVHLDTVVDGEHKKHIIIDSRNPALYSRFTFTGKSRSIAEDKYEFLKIRFLGASDEPFFKLYGDNEKDIVELEFKQDNISYWFPIQKKVYLHFQKEVRKDDEVILLLRYFGAIFKTHIYLLIDFDSTSEHGTHEE